MPTQLQGKLMNDKDWLKHQDDGTWPQANAHAGEGVTPYKVLSEADLMALEDPKWLIDNLLLEKSFAVLYGPPGSGKSFIALSMAKSIQTGTDFLGHKIRNPGSVLYVAAEDIHGFKRRVEAWKAHHQPPPTEHGIRFLGQAVILNDTATLDRIVSAIKGSKATIVIFDTLARCTPGVEENSSKDMGKIIQMIDNIRQKTGAVVLLVHHSGKDTGRGARGSNALLGAVDTEIECSDRKLKITKQKSSAPGEPTCFKLEPACDSVVPVYRRFDDTGDTTKRDVVLQALRDICPTGSSVTNGQWEDATKDAGIGRSMYFMHRKLLIDQENVTQHGSDRAARFSPNDPE